MLGLGFLRARFGSIGCAVFESRFVCSSVGFETRMS